jgi:hypothetical protein
VRCLVLVFIVACMSSDALPPPGPLGTLTVQRIGSAVGYVDSDPPAIMCGSKCSAAFPGGTMVTLFPSIGPDGAFTGWSGACSGKQSCTVMIDGDQTVSAMFPCTGKKVFNYVGGAEAIQRFSAPACAGHVIIEADGGQGGNAGGLGAQIRGTFAITTQARRNLTVLVGGVGGADVLGVGLVHGGGGGGSFVYLDATDALPLIAAGGGGGTSSGCSGGPGSATQTPTMASGGTGSAPGGSNGGGAGGGTSTRGSADFGSGTGGGGGGWLSNGQAGTFGSKGDGGDAPRNGGSGGSGSINNPYLGGGFGGGGAAAGRASGGGGGFNGGGGGNDFVLTALGCGGGGGSYNGGEDPVNGAGLWVGYGRVTIIWTE